MRAASRTPLLAGVLTMLIAATFLLGAPVAAAHEGEGQLVLESLAEAAPAGDGSPARYIVAVALTYLADGHGVDDATVTLAGEAVAGPAAGTELTPVTLEPAGAGRFTAGVELGEGSWNLRITSVEPAARLELEPITVVPGPSSSASSTTTVTTTTTSAGRDTSAPPTTEAVSEEESGGGASPWVPIGIAVAAVGAGAFGVAAWRRRADLPSTPDP